MSQPVGMLRFRGKDGLMWAVEASMVDHIQPVSPVGEGGCISQIFLKTAGWVPSLDGSEELMDQYDRLVRTPGYIPLSSTYVGVAPAPQFFLPDSGGGLQQ